MLVQEIFLASVTPDTSRWSPAPWPRSRPEGFGAESEVILKRHLHWAHQKVRRKFLGLPGLASCPARAAVRMLTWDGRALCSTSSWKEVWEGEGMFRDSSQQGLVFQKWSDFRFMDSVLTSHRSLCWAIPIFIYLFFAQIGLFVFGTAADSCLPLTWACLSPKMPCTCSRVSRAVIIEHCSVSLGFFLNEPRVIPEISNKSPVSHSSSEYGHGCCCFCFTTLPTLWWWWWRQICWLKIGGKRNKFRPVRSHSLIRYVSDLRAHTHKAAQE